MKNLYLLLLFFIIVATGCNPTIEVEEKPFANGRKYPDQVEIIDLNTENDCSLSNCSADRVIRLKTKRNEGKIYW